MSIRLVNPIFAGSVPALDFDAKAYINAVEAIDGKLENGVRAAINAFVIGLKADGIWTAIKASCILAGARSLAGALVPLVGTAPTNVGFVASDYNRKNGLTGNGTTKYLNTNRAGNADPQDSTHLSVNLHTIHTTAAAGMYLGNGSSGTGASNLIRGFNFPNGLQHGSRCRAATSATPAGSNPPAAGFFAVNRSQSSQFVMRTGGTNYTATVTSETRPTESFLVFARGNGSGVAEFYTNATINFYSVGESLDLALLDARVSTLIAAIGAAIP